ncbi:chemotaxis protein CheW [Reichenbachiella agarivorans]|uniref:Chemotaxis protein CheW n=1 Tax=Reichenbachiella agarivorans TaxID=2979464 RepID=A0ABY6CKT0_9BACT|nr:chemotaxis protein CheW [Reichenbachiella agarivorans]UXP31092.1 chemotaxis protein CheW [Reichenbachiella agarivorans]
MQEIAVQDKANKTKLSESERMKLINDTANAVKEVNQMAGESSTKEAHEETIMLVAFSVGKEVYAVSIDQIKEVVSCPDIAPIPQVPPFVKGVANVRGNVLAIIDLAIRFGLAHEGEQGRFVLVMKSEELKFAISVNAVPNTMMIKRSQVTQATNIINQSTLGLNYVKGIIRRDDNIVVWVDILSLMENEVFGEI